MKNKIYKLRVWLVFAISRWCGIPICHAGDVRLKKVFIDRTDLLHMKIEHTFDEDYFYQMYFKPDFLSDFAHIAGIQIAEYIIKNYYVSRYEIESPSYPKSKIFLSTDFWVAMPGRAADEMIKETHKPKP